MPRKSASNRQAVPDIILKTPEYNDCTCNMVQKRLSLRNRKPKLHASGNDTQLRENAACSDKRENLFWCLGRSLLGLFMSEQPTSLVYYPHIVARLSRTSSTSPPAPTTRGIQSTHGAKAFTGSLGCAAPPSERNLNRALAFGE